MFLPSLALTSFKMAPRLEAYSLTLAQSTSSSSHRSILLPTTASTISLGPLACSSSTHFFMTSYDLCEVISQTQSAILAYRQQMGAMDLYFYCPAVSQIWNSMDLPVGSVCFFVKNAAPRVGSLQSLNFQQVNLVRMEVLPTPESPTAINLIWLIYSPFYYAIVDIQLNEGIIIIQTGGIELKYSQREGKGRAGNGKMELGWPVVYYIIIKMEFGFASDRTNNAYFDRVVQSGVDTSISEISYCLQTCKITHRAHFQLKLSFQQKACLQNCAKIMSLEMNLEEE